MIHWGYVNDDCIVDEDSGVQYRPYLSLLHGSVGYEATHPDGRREFITLNPSGGSDDGVPTVFVYIDTDEPTLENAVHHYIMFDEEEA